ncbi:Uu.00g051460.m01.CDS01 [Anthostomella pinea]|uniref:Uu.00g051460.m01.CDS01 n=1 Tax=Anthostomella pinea TaxID=933095 RepID=A0AAI8YML9_9PEZI|nr:Uu.00g051460.m01.CDS01 [Anthostomella pinea]
MSPLGTYGSYNSLEKDQGVGVTGSAPTETLLASIFEACSQVTAAEASMMP